MSPSSYDGAAYDMTSQQSVFLHRALMQLLFKAELAEFLLSVVETVQCKDAMPTDELLFLVFSSNKPQINLKWIISNVNPTT